MKNRAMLLLVALSSSAAAVAFAEPAAPKERISLCENNFCSLASGNCQLTDIPYQCDEADKGCLNTPCSET